MQYRLATQSSPRAGAEMASPTTASGASLQFDPSQCIVPPPETHTSSRAVPDIEPNRPIFRAHVWPSKWNKEADTAALAPTHTSSGPDDQRPVIDPASPGTST